LALGRAGVAGRRVERTGAEIRRALDGAGILLLGVRIAVFFSGVRAVEDTERIKRVVEVSMGALVLRETGLLPPPSDLKRVEVAASIDASKAPQAGLE
jgi:hypothetical protein